MTDIVERLRSDWDTDKPDPLRLEAADEIERLRRDLEWAQDKLAALEPDWHISRPLE